MKGRGIYEDRMNSKLLIFSFLLLMSACAEFTSPRSFVDEMDRESDGFWVAGRDFPTVTGDSGTAYRSREEVRQRTPMNEKQKERYQSREVVKRQLQDMEDNLSESERVRYNNDSQYLANTSEKIYYLNLSPRDRSEYLMTKQPGMMRSQDSSQDLYTDSSSLKSAASFRAPASVAGDVALGMSKEEVKKIWGKPIRVDIAGDPRNQNERWVFYEAGRMKQLYFESGKVEGWSLE